MDNVVICIDNSIPSSSDHKSIERHSSRLRQIVIAIEVICRQILLENPNNIVSIVVFASDSGAKCLLKHNSDMNTIESALKFITDSSDTQLDFIRGVEIASQCLRNGISSENKLWIFVKNRIQCTNKEMGIQSLECLATIDNLFVRIISIGTEILRNRQKFQEFERTLKSGQNLKFFEVIEYQELNAKNFLFDSIDSNLLEISPGNMKSFKARLNLLEQNNKNEVIGRLEDRIKEIEIERNNLLNSDIDEASKTVAIDLLDQNLQEVRNEMNAPNAGTDLCLGSDTEIQILNEDSDFKKAIELSLKENYKNNSQLNDNKKWFKISFKSNTKDREESNRKNKVKKFKEGIKDD